MIKKIIITYFLGIILSGCATVPNIPEKPTTFLFHNAEASDLASKFTIICGASGSRIVSSSNSMVECAQPMGDSFKETIYKALMVEQRGASNPDFHFQWTFSNINGNVLASAHTWIEHQNAFGKDEKNDLGTGVAGIILEKALEAWNKNH